MVGEAKRGSIDSSLGKELHRARADVDPWQHHTLSSQSGSKRLETMRMATPISGMPTMVSQSIFTMIGKKIIYSI